MSIKSMKISQPVVIVAGAGGAGAVLTQYLVKRDVRVVLLDSKADVAAGVAEPLLHDGLPVTWQAIDLLDVEQIVALRNQLSTDYFREADAAAVTAAIKALLTDQMIAANPEKDFLGFTHVNHLAEVITDLILGNALNGSRIDLTLTV